MWSSGSCWGKLLSLYLFLCCSLWPSPGKPAPGLWDRVYFPSCLDLRFPIGQRVWVGCQWDSVGTVDHCFPWRSHRTLFLTSVYVFSWRVLTPFRALQGCVGCWTVLLCLLRPIPAVPPGTRPPHSLSGLACAFLGTSFPDGIRAFPVPALIAALQAVVSRCLRCSPLALSRRLRARNYILSQGCPCFSWNILD